MLAKIKRRFNWINASVLTLLPIAAFLSVSFYIYYQGIHWVDVAILALMYSGIGLAITGGYHRFYAHRAYDCHPIVQCLFLTFGAAALENSVLCWASDHRRHHRYVDHDEDPYNITKGFFWAHMGWIFFDTHSNASDSRFENAHDLKKDKFVLWQHKYYLPLAVFFGFGVPMILGWAVGQTWGGLIWGGLIRQFLTHHTTFLINSAAHWFGKRPYSKQNTARDSWWLAIFSFGEGFHNFHHAFPSDYRNGIRWYHWDPTKWVIRALSWIKLSWGLRKTPKQSIIESIDRAKNAIGQCTGALQLQQRGEKT